MHRKLASALALLVAWAMLLVACVLPAPVAPPAMQSTNLWQTY